MNRNISFFQFIFFFLIIFASYSKAELTNKIIISVGDEIITDYDLTRELKYLNVIPIGNFKNLEYKYENEHFFCNFGHG